MSRPLIFGGIFFPAFIPHLFCLLSLFLSFCWLAFKPNYIQQLFIVFNFFSAHLSLFQLLIFILSSFTSFGILNYIQIILVLALELHLSILFARFILFYSKSCLLLIIFGSSVWCFNNLSYQSQIHTGKRWGPGL